MLNNVEDKMVEGVKSIGRVLTLGTMIPYFLIRGIQKKFSDNSTNSLKN